MKCARTGKTFKSKRKYASRKPSIKTKKQPKFTPAKSKKCLSKKKELLPPPTPRPPQPSSEAKAVAAFKKLISKKTSSKKAAEKSKKIAASKKKEPGQAENSTKSRKNGATATSGKKSPLSSKNLRKNIGQVREKLDDLHEQSVVKKIGKQTRQAFSSAKKRLLLMNREKKKKTAKCILAILVFFVFWCLFVALFTAYKYANMDEQDTIDLFTNAPLPDFEDIEKLSVHVTERAKLATTVIMGTTRSN